MVMAALTLLSLGSFFSAVHCAPATLIASSLTHPYEDQCTALEVPGVEAPQLSLLQLMLKVDEGQLLVPQAAFAQVNHPPYNGRSSCLHRMRWWKAAHASAAKPPTEKYVLFTHDDMMDGGPNNIRMGWEYTGVVAEATNRTLVLPPAFKIYLLDGGPDRGNLHEQATSESLSKQYNTTTRVEDLLNLKQLKANLPTLTWEEFVARTGIESLDAAISKSSRVADTDICTLDAYQKVDAQLLFMPGGGRRDAQFYSGLHCAQLYGLGGPTPKLRDTLADAEWSLLTHGFVWHQDAFDIASHVVNFLGIFNYTALHARYNDFQFHDKQQTPAQMFAGMGDLLQKQGLTLYLASDEPDKFKEVVKSSKVDVVTFADMMNGPLKHVKSKYTPERWFKMMGMVEELICTYAKVFIGSPLSSFSGHIQRMRLHAKAPVTRVITHMDTNVDIEQIEQDIKDWEKRDELHHFRLPVGKGDEFLTRPH